MDKDPRHPDADETAATPDAAAAPESEAPLSDPQELDFLELREGRQWTGAEVDRAIVTGRELIADAEADSGLRLWRRGDMLRDFYMGFPERTKGRPKFVPFAAEVFDLGEEEVREAIRLRKEVKSAEEARKIGRSKLIMGLRLCEKLGLQTLAALSHHDLALKGGGTCRFPRATRRQLQAALDLLGKKAPPAAPSERQKAEAARMNARLDEKRKTDPDLRAATVRYAVHNRSIVLDARRLTARQRVALARFILELEEEKQKGTGPREENQ